MKYLVIILLLFSFNLDARGMKHDKRLRKRLYSLGLFHLDPIPNYEVVLIRAWRKGKIELEGSMYGYKELTNDYYVKIIVHEQVWKGTFLLNAKYAVVEVLKQLDKEEIRPKSIIVNVFAYVKPDKYEEAGFVKYLFWDDTDIDKKTDCVWKLRMDYKLKESYFDRLDHKYY